MPLYQWTEADVFRVAERAHALYRQGRVREATVLFEGLTAVDPTNAYCGHALGACYLRLGEAQKAVFCLTEVLNHHPADPPALGRRCEAYLALNQIDAASRDLQTLERVGSPELQSLKIRLETARRKPLLTS